MTFERERAVREKRAGGIPGRGLSPGVCAGCVAGRGSRWCWPAWLGHCQAVSGAEPGVSIRLGKRLKDQVRWPKSPEGSAWPRTQRAGCTTPPPGPASGCRPGCRAGQPQSPLMKPPERWGEDYRLWAQVSLGQGVGDGWPSPAFEFPVLLNLKGSRTPVVSLKNQPFSTCSPAAPGCCSLVSGLDRGRGAVRALEGFSWGCL